MKGNPHALAFGARVRAAAKTDAATRPESEGIGEGARERVRARRG
jgi:hypothetical protein